MPITSVWYSLGENLYFLVDKFPAFYIVLFCSFGSVVFIVILFASRITKSYYHRRENSLRFQYQKILNKIVVNAMFSENGAPNAAFEFYMAELRLIAGNSVFSRQLLLTCILDIKKNVTGNSAKALVKTYYTMLLHKQSVKKLKSIQWQKKALGIRELAEMRYAKATAVVTKFLYSNNPILRQESFMALVRLEDKPLSFLDHYKGDLSLWMRINIYRHLQTMELEKLPIFSQYFNHPNISVRLFSISMARQFKQTASVRGVVDMLYSDNAKVVGLAISTLGDMEAYQHRDEIIKLSHHVWPFDKLSKRLVQCLGSIGDKQTDVPLIGKFLDHPIYSVRFEAASALKKMGSQGEDFLKQYNGEGKIDELLGHLSEPLLI